MKLRTGFIGLGEMGKWMAINVVRAGFPLTVYDIRPDPMKDLVAYGVTPARNATEAARESDCVLLSLPDEHVVETVLFGDDGLIQGLSPGTIVADLNTIDYLATLRIEE